MIHDHTVNACLVRDVNRHRGSDTTRLMTHSVFYGSSYALPSGTQNVKSTIYDLITFSESVATSQFKAIMPGLLDVMRSNAINPQKLGNG